MWKFFREEWKAISKIPFKVISILGVSIIPIIYSITYIISFYNPFDTKDYPIGFISQDEGVKVNKEFKNYGKDIEKELHNNHKLKWKFFNSKEDADKSLNKKGGVYGIFIIDKNFSKDLLSIKSVTPVKPIINFYQNPKKNYTATIVNKTVVRTIQESILDNVIKESSTTIKDKINNSDSKLNTAIEGIKKLDDGMGTLKSSVDKALSSLNSQVKTLDIIRYQLENSNAAMAYKKLGIDLDTMQNSSDPKVQSLASRIKNDKPSMFAAMFGIDYNDFQLAMNKVKDPSTHKELEDKINKLNQGVTQLKDATGILNNKVVDTTNKIPKNEIKENSQDLVDFIAHPTSAKVWNTAHIQRYGYGFAPFAIAIGLWVGGMVTGFVLEYKPISKYKPKKYWQFLWGKLMCYAVVSVLQAICLETACYIAGVPFEKPLILFVFMLFSNLTFMVIQFLFMVALGLSGKFVSMILMIIQLTSSGGTYPIEVLPPFYQFMHYKMPFTYTVEIIREFLYQPNYATIFKYLVPIVIWMVVSLLLLLVVKPIDKEKKQLGY